MQFLLILLITIAPILLWGIYFYFHNPRKQPVVEIVKIFLIGTFSVFPVILFHKYFSETATSYLTELLHVEDIVIIPSLLNLFLTIFFIVLFIFLFAFIQSTFVSIFHKLPWSHNFKAISKKMYHLTPLLLFFLLFIFLSFFYQ